METLQTSITQRQAPLQNMQTFWESICKGIGTSEEIKGKKEDDLHINPAHVHHEKSPDLLSEINMIIMKYITPCNIAGALRDRSGDSSENM